MSEPMRANDFPLRRREVAKQIHSAGGDELLLVTGLGSPNWDFTVAGDKEQIFPLWGAMGGAISIGLGLALAQPSRRVMVATGDAEALMGVGSLATVAVQSPPNMAIVILDNERYGETGMQTTATAHKTDLSAIAAGSGIILSETIHDQAALDLAIPKMMEAPGPCVFVIKVRAESLPFVLPPKDGAYLKDRFRFALLGDAAIV
ncbi:MAG: aldehyde dehydrogenase [Rhodospirillaceae bacterium TMED8]|nr:aldehyde dehydrogenase [Magnetovibrio sp.]OUT49025.1 MAG: aldehyde dehydrogenase [Rhodospirillaceae bacterium TMED8]|tara:strand:- start:208 stop:819 length:612 start_codon:yes stop_codon:yes gene_type:complete